MLPDIGGHNVPQLVQVVLVCEVRKVPVTARHILVYAVQVQTKYLQQVLHGVWCVWVMTIYPHQVIQASLRAGWRGTGGDGQHQILCRATHVPLYLCHEELVGVWWGAVRVATVYAGGGQIQSARVGAEGDILYTLIRGRNLAPEAVTLAV